MSGVGTVLLDLIPWLVAVVCLEPTLSLPPKFLGQPSLVHAMVFSRGNALLRHDGGPLQCHHQKGGKMPLPFPSDLLVHGSQPGLRLVQLELYVGLTLVCLSAILLSPLQTW